jgi:peptidase M23-like protein
MVDSRGPGAVGISSINLLLAAGVVIVFTAAYESALLVALPIFPIAVALGKIASRVWHARRRGLEYGLLRRPLRRELRPYQVQAVNQLVFWILLAAALLVGTADALDAVIAPGAADALRVAGWIGLVVIAACALVPRRRIYLPTNILTALGSIFLAVQLVRIFLPPVNPVAIDLPLQGEWYVFSAGRSTLVNDHFPALGQRHAIDLFQFADGRLYHGDKKRLESYPAFGKTLVAPADGRVVRFVDTYADLVPGKTDKEHPVGNYLVLDIGHVYVGLVHLKQGSVTVSAGEEVRRGQPIAQVGNTGNTGAPHLHIQVDNLPRLGVTVAGLYTRPILFRDVVVSRRGEQRTRAEADVRRGDRIRRASG